jgi:hypothetical protein
MSDQTRLEDAFRTGLQRHADDMDTTADLLGPARSAARGRRRRTWVAGSVGLAAAALVTAAVVQSVGDEPDRGTTVADTLSDPLPTEWRAEAWHGLQVEVPADWGLGVAPVGSPSSLARCGGPYDEPYVGRPVATTDVCTSAFMEPPTDPYVWLGAAVEPGEIDLGDGYVQTTIEAEGTTLSVATTNPELTQRILDSAGPVQGCAGSVPTAPAVDMMLMEGLRNPSGAQVCAYQQDLTSSDSRDPYELVYATTLDAEQATSYHAEVYPGLDYEDVDGCEVSSEYVMITIVGEDPYGGPGSEVTQDTVVNPFCRGVQGSPANWIKLSDAGMAAWSRGWAGQVLLSFIGPQG